MRAPILLLTLCLGPAVWLPLALALALAPVPAQAQQVQRCVTAQGGTVYTDKRCEDIGAINRLPRPGASGVGSSTSLYRGGCSRTLSDLVYQITSAIDAHDVNRLSSVYAWSNVSNAAANRILTQLEAIVERPLVDIVPVRPRPPPIYDEDGTMVDANTDGYYPQTTVRQRPVGLRLEQTLANGSTPSRTVFGLRRNYNCFWITL